MNFEFKLPDLGEGIVEGEVVKWLVKEGDRVTEDMPLLEVMTDKATVEITSPKDGTIGKILKNEGDIVEVEQIMVLIEVAGEVVPEAASSEAKASGPTSEVTKPSSISPASRSGPVKASPATRKLAREMNVDLSLVSGSGPGGRITHEDLQNFSNRPPVGAPSPSPVTATSPATPVLTFEGAIERIPFRGLRKKIAENMVRSVHGTAHFSYVDTVDMTALVALRNQWKKKAQDQGAKLTYLPFIMKAAVAALKTHPRFNASLDEQNQEIVLKKYFHLGIATATERGLVVPVVRDVDQKSLLSLAKEVSELTERTRAMKADLSELKGSSFTITSLGALGGLFATPIINYPETSIMGIYQIKPTPVVKNDKVVIQEVMYFSLSLDHRVIDGHEAASFGNEFKKHLEDPSILFSKLT